jgi:hypothetical protein
MPLNPSNFRNKHYENEEKLWLEWNSTTTQKAQHKANDDLNDTKHRRIFVKSCENEEKFVVRRKKLTVAGVYSTTTQ